MRRNSLDIATLSAADRTLTVGGDLLLSDNLDSVSDNQKDFVRFGLQQMIASPFRVGFTTFLLCVSGEYRIRINLIDYELRPNQLLIIPEGSISEYPLMDFGCGLLMIAFSPKLSPIDNPLIASATRRNSVFDIRSIALQPDEARAICSIYKILRSRVGLPGFAAKSELAKSAIDMVLNYLSPHLLDPVAPQSVKLSGHDTFIRFLRLLDRHCTSHRELAFYASQLSMTPRSVSRIVMQLTGRSPKDWIAERVILEAKALLNVSHLSILQVSERLGFPNQSFFGSYFRRATGMSPLAYRTARARR